MNHLPIFQNAVIILGVGLVLPLVAGIIARIFFFRHDKDDAEANTETNVPSPDPEPRNRQPWPRFDRP